ncbi:MAG: DUF6384 family protein [Hyphomonadaceae bacterium]|nr:DUF6384 family protein [Hyphomonadaceae bacterium]
MNDATAAPKPLDEVLLAMDVVDTLRHREQTLMRELDEVGRRAELIERLKDIYHAQGIEVPESVIVEGVKALKEQRFAYTPPKPSLSVRLAKIYVSRGRWGLPVLAVLAILGISGTVYQVGVAGPATARAEAARVELTQTLPEQVAALENEIGRIATQDRATALAATYVQDARSALRDENAEDAKQAIAALQALRDELTTSYEIRVVYGPDEPRSGVIRLNDNVPGNTLYYLIVEAVDPAGRRVERLITNQEDTSARRTSKWGQEVSEADFNRVAADKQDDLIIQDAVIGTKPVGALDPDFTVNTTGGAILEW